MKITNQYVEDWIREYMDDDGRNTLKEVPGRAWGEPLVGFSSAQDELYPFYKRHISQEFYRLPQEWLEKAYGRAFDPAQVSVISWALPQTEENRMGSRAEKECPPIGWQMARVHGEECSRAMAKALEEHFREMGIEAIAPMCSDEFSWGKSERFGPISNWSERHTALISGLGTFGLCDALISKKGKAARYGSVIVACVLEPTKRDYTEYNEYCMAKDGCTACMARCPAGAITKDGHDKAKCVEYHQRVIKKICHERDGYEGYAVCGLCQTGVPCECGIQGRK